MTDEFKNITRFKEGLKTLEFNLNVIKFHKIRDDNFLHCNGKLITLNGEENISFYTIVDPYVSNSKIQPIEFEFYLEDNPSQKNNFVSNVDHISLNTDLNLDNFSIDQIINIYSKNQSDTDLKLKLKLQFLETPDVFINKEDNQLSDGDQIFIKTGVADYDHKELVEYDAINYGNGNFTLEIIQNDKILFLVSN